MTPLWPQLRPEQVDAAIASGTVILDFFHDACAPCHALEPRLAAVLRRHPRDLGIYQVVIDDDGETPARFGIMSVPTVLVFRDGREVARLDGLTTEEDLSGAIASEVPTTRPAVRD